MIRTLLKSKIHRASVTACDADYVGSISIDPELMRAADLLPNEQVHVWDIDNGARFVTYAIEGEPGAREVKVNGAAARLVNEGDKVIVRSEAGEMTARISIAEIRPRNLAMYYPEANALVPRRLDPRSKTPAFKSVEVGVERFLSSRA